MKRVRGREEDREKKREMKRDRAKADGWYEVGVQIIFCKRNMSKFDVLKVLPMIIFNIMLYQYLNVYLCI
jgi:hypothetical protein